MKITIDLEAVNGKQHSLLDFLKREEIPFEEEWDEETIKAYNKDIDEAEVEFERGEFLTMEEVEKEIENWKNAKRNMEQISIETSVEEWDEKTITSYNRELNEAEARIEAGEFTTQEQLEKEMASW